MSSLTLNGLKSMDSMRSLWAEGTWFHMSLQNLQKWHGWNYFGSKSTLKNASSTFYVAPIRESDSQTIKRQISEDGAEFFEKFASIRQKVEQPRRTVLDMKAEAQNTLTSGQEKGHPRPQPRSRPRSRPRKMMDTLWPQLTFGPEAEVLYQEALYSILHGLGSWTESEVENQLLCLRRAFRFNEEKHLKLLNEVRQKPAPEVALQVNVMEGRNLRGKGVNGLSDPFCCLWLASSKQRQQNTTMKLNNLDPVWNEVFEFPLKNAQDDVLHIEVWDFDPDETVKEKISRMKQVKSCKGFGKFLKEIAIASTAPGKPAHQFLGQFTVIVKSVPVLGMERWFPLEGRDKKKPKNRGDIKLQLSLVTKDCELQGTFQESLEHYQQLVKVFVDYELRTNPEWNGVLGDPESDLLRLFGAQRGLRPILMDLVYWCVLSEALYVKNLQYSLLWNILERCRKYLEETGTSPEVDLMFWKAVDSFLSAAMMFIRNVPNNSNLVEDPEQLKSLLMCLRELRILDQSKKAGKLSSLETLIKKAITLGAADWYNQAADFHRIGNSISEEDDRLESCIQLCQDVMPDLKRALTAHNDIFMNILQVPYFSIIYEFYDSQLAAVCSAVVESATRSLKSLDFDENCLNLAALEACGEFKGPDLTSGIKDNHPVKNLDPKISMGTALFELYLSLQQFQKLSAVLNKEEADRLKVRNFHIWFSKAVGRWLSIALYKALIRIGKAVALDNFVPVDGLVKHSNSAVDAVTIFYQIKTFWQQLSWPDPEGSVTFAMKIMDDICRCCTFYADVIDRKLQKTISNLEIKFVVTEQILCIIHDILHVRKAIRPMAEALEIRTLFIGLNQAPTAIETVLESAEENIDSKLDEMFCSIARRIESGVVKLLHADWDSPAAVSQRGDLINYLDTNLVNLKCHLEPEIFEKILKIIGERVMHAILNAVNSDIENKRQPSYFKHWDHLLKLVSDFFYGTEHEEDEILARIRKILKIHGSETSYLIHQYCLERLRSSNLQETKYGKLSVRAMFVGDNLIVEVLNGRNLKATNSRGSCDPYIKVQLMLMEKTSETVHKTKVQKNTLFPLFDEKFTFKVPQNLQMNPECFVLFRLKDHDSIVSGEFVAETHLEFQNIPRRTSTAELSELEQIHLNFSKSSVKDSEYFQILETRTWDKVAKEFVKKEKKRVGVKSFTP